MPNWRDLLRAWDQNPVALAKRKYIYREIGPISAAFAVLFAVIGQWVAFGFMVALLALSLVTGARMPGTHAQRLFARLWGRGEDARRNGGPV